MAGMTTNASQFSVFSRAGPARAALEVVTNRWALLALRALRDGPRRFNGLARRVDGVSPKMLSQTLQALERDGFVNRHIHTTSPLHVEYSLTPLGEAMADQHADLINLVETAMPHVLTAQQHYDTAKPADSAESSGPNTQRHTANTSQPQTQR
jgi:DNA-binding HxlR family transcriptional regulator